jgi:RND superfamily putative drug exporter
MTRRLARWCAQHRLLVIGGWLAVLLASTLAAHLVGPTYSGSLRLPQSDSTQAIALLQRAAPGVSGDEEQIVFGTTVVGTHLRDRSIEARITASLARVAVLPHVAKVSSPYVRGSQQRNLDDTIGFATVYLDVGAQQLDGSAGTTFLTVARSASGPDLQVAVSGQIAEERAGSALGDVWLGIALAVAVLLLVFGSLLAAMLPMLAALAALGTALALNTLLTHLLVTPPFADQLVLLIGLGVGVDYALFIVSRHRQALLSDENPAQAIETSLATSGRAVAFAGAIVCLGLLGMLALGVHALDGTAVAAALGVALTMAAALTLIPALLSLTGLRVLGRRRRRLLTLPPGERPETGRTWARWADTVRRHPVLPALGAVVVIAALALPLASLRLGESDPGNDPPSSTTRQAYDLLARGFGAGFNGPFEIVALANDPAQVAALDRVQAAVESVSAIAHVGRPTLVPTPSGELALVPAYPAFDAQDPRTPALLAHLRTTVIPAAVGDSGLQVHVGGTSASFVDLTRALSVKLPAYVAVIALLAVAVLALVFRSVLIPLTAALVNLMSAAAAFGVLVAVFQYGWLGSLIGADRTGPVEPFVPVLLFAVLFGLSMDYEVFLVSRIHEEWLATGDTATGVRNGLAATGRTITAAGLIMVMVFGSFMLSGERVIKEVGLGLAVGIAIDAVIVRSVLIPAVMLLLGRANWWFPGVQPAAAGPARPVAP